LVPEDDLVDFIIEPVKALPTGEFVFKERGTGYAQYPPSMMLALLTRAAKSYLGMDPGLCGLQFEAAP
jgi:transposase